MLRPPRVRGQSIVEMAVVLPIFLTVIFGCIDFGLGISAKLMVANAVREGARLAAVSWGSDDADSAVQAKVTAGLTAVLSATLGATTMTYPDGKNAGRTVRVGQSCTYNFLIPLPKLVGVTSLDCGAAMTMRLE